MAVADGAILRIVASMLFPDSVIAQNVFYAVFTDTGTSDDEDDVLDDLVDYVDAMFTHINSQVSALAASTTIKVYNYDSTDDDWDEVGDGVLTWSPAGAGEMLPHGVAALIHAKTIDPDVQAAKFLGAVPESQCASSTIIGTAITKYALFADEWVAPFTGAATGALFAPGVWSVAQNVFKLFNGTVLVNATSSYQRRRKPGVGI